MNKYLLINLFFSFKFHYTVIYKNIVNKDII